MGACGSLERRSEQQRLRPVLDRIVNPVPPGEFLKRLMRPRRGYRSAVDSLSGHERIQRAAQRLFGHDTLLPGQAETMHALLDGRDVLLVSPTGSGKSLTYQVAGVLLEGCTVVVSPLLALQEDQMRGLGREHPELRAARISSAESQSQRE